MSNSSALYSSKFLKSLKILGQYSITKASWFFFFEEYSFSESRSVVSPKECEWLKGFFFLKEFTSTSKSSKSILSSNIFLYII